jgi:hypothetical protein
VQLAGAYATYEHIEEDDIYNPAPYRQSGTLLLTDLTLNAARGLTDGFGIGIRVPFRLVRTRVSFSDLDGNPFLPVHPDFHHRNETLTGIADPLITLMGSRPLGAYMLGASAGVTVPLGSTVPNPFELGRLGLKHEHIQFGTGTWNPLFGLTATRLALKTVWSAGASARLTFSQNIHGYQAGDLFTASLGASRMVAAKLSGRVALLLSREEAEHWSGVLEDEGNLGRTDLSASAGASRMLGKGGMLSLDLQLSLYSHTTGAQVHTPIALVLGWSK